MGLIELFLIAGNRFLLWLEMGLMEAVRVNQKRERCELEKPKQ